MELKEVTALIEAFNEAGLSSLSLKCEAFELALGKELALVKRSLERLEGASQPVIIEEKIAPQEQQEMKMIKAPIVGTFYAAPDPKAKPLVEVGSYVKKGDVVCIIEAMKLMNEVEADVEGEVVSVLVANEELVGYDQPLFILK